VVIEVPDRPPPVPTSTPLDEDVFRGERLTPGGRLLRAIEEGRLTIREDDHASGGGAGPFTVDELLEWSLPDFNALRDIAARLGVVLEQPPPLICRNCDAPLEGDPRRAPIDDLDRWYEPGRLDQPVLEAASRLPLPRPFRPPGAQRPIRSFQLDAPTVRQVLPVWRVLGSASRRPERYFHRPSEPSSSSPPWPPPLPPRPGVLRALGLTALGPIRSPRRLARALENAPSDVWSTIETAFALRAYAAEGTRPVACHSCGAVHDVDAPTERETWSDPEAEDLLLGADGVPAPEVSDPSGDPEPFPPPDAFDDRVLRIADEVFDELGVAAVDLDVDHGVPPVDGAGVPLLGSYRVIPDEGAEFGLPASDFGGGARRFRIELYYETFRRTFEEDPYDVDEEIRETIAHEVEHHFHELAGHDPLDEAERAEAAREVALRFGERYVARAARHALWAPLTGFLRLVFPVLLLLALGLAGYAWLRG